MFSHISSGSLKVDNVFLFITGISFLLLLLIIILIIVFIIKYNSKKHPCAEDIRNNIPLEIVWTIIPTVLVMLMFYYGWVGFLDLRNVPPDAMEVEVTGKMWSWSYKYENGIESDVLKVPLKRPVKLLLNSLDVVHSFYAPAFRVKEDAVPGMVNYTWFEALKKGTYEVFCAEYCGQRHSYMRSKINVMKADDFNVWYNSQGMALKAGLLKTGNELMMQKGCLACHSTDGSILIGPSFKGIYDKKEIVISEDEEREITVDDGYIRKSIFEPQADVVKGFPPIMPSQKGLITEEEVGLIVDYIKELK